MSESNKIVSSAKYVLNFLRNTLPALSFLDDTGFILLGYLAAWIVVFLIGLFIKESKAPDALDRRYLFDARTKLKEQELEIANLRKNMPDVAEQKQLQRNYEDIQQKLEEEQRLNSFLHEKFIEEKDQLIVTLQDQKRSEIAQIEQEKDLELTQLRAEIETLTAELKKKQETLKLQPGQSEKEAYEEQFSHLNKEIETLRIELSEKKAHADKREEEASSQREQLNKLLEMITEKEQKIGRIEAEQGQLKEIIRHLENEVHKFEIMKQQGDQTIKELKDRIEKTDELKSKLQNRWFHDERNYTAKIRNLEEEIAKIKTSVDAPNAVTSMPKRDYSSDVDDVPDLWAPFNANNSSHRENNLATGSLFNYRYKPRNH